MADALPLLEQIRQGQIQALEARFSNNSYPARAFLAEPRAWGEEMWMPIHHAAACGQTAVVDLLLNLGISVDARTRFHTPMHARQTALHFAAIGDHPTTVARLMARGAEVDVRDADGRSPLAWAARYGRAQIVGLLSEHGAMVDLTDLQGRSPLHLALIGPDTAEAASTPAQPSATHLTDDSQVEQPLRGVLGPHPCPTTSDEARLATVTALIFAGAEVDARCPKEPTGYTPLHRCVTLGESRLACARALLTARADPTLPDPRFGHSAVALAAAQGAAAYVQLFRAAGFTG